MMFRLHLLFRPRFNINLMNCLRVFCKRNVLWVNRERRDRRNLPIKVPHHKCTHKSRIPLHFSSKIDVEFRSDYCLIILRSAINELYCFIYVKLVNFTVFFSAFIFVILQYFRNWNSSNTTNTLFCSKLKWYLIYSIYLI